MSGPFVDAYHGDTYRPWRITNRKPEVGIVRTHILTGLHVMNDLGDVFEDIGLELALFQKFKKAMKMLFGLLVKEKIHARLVGIESGGGLFVEVPAPFFDKFLEEFVDGRFCLFRILF